MGLPKVLSRALGALGVLRGCAASPKAACHTEECVSFSASSSASSSALLQVAQAPSFKANSDGFDLCVVRDNKCIDLHMDATWDDGVTSNPAPELNWTDAQLVVARYDEDLRWLDALPQVPTVIYNRGDEQSRLLPKARENLRILHQRNRGREDQVFLQHIHKNYDHLAQATVFLQGWPFGHCPGFLRAVRRALTAVLTPQMAGPVTAGYIEGLAPVTSTFWHYDIEGGLIGLALQMAERNVPPEHRPRAAAEVKDAFAEICQEILRKPCPRQQWVAEGAQWAVSRDRIHSTPRHLYAKAMSLGEGWAGKIRGLVLEAIWPVLFGADHWEPTQVDYLPELRARANNRARSNDDYCELATGAVSGTGAAWRHLIYSCSQRVEYCERQRHAGSGDSQSFEVERQQYEIDDAMGFLPWSLAAQLRLVLFGSSRWWPRNSPQARQSLPSAIADRGYSPLVVELNGRRIPVGKGSVE
ncbi:unnamed protein product [Durusdinium trenchii]|uniref:Selenoprotein O n=1 Tax=Durusdinium trenchii TaxID=1381693 RepID=A0ABP0QFM8_9DINO